MSRRRPRARITSGAAAVIALSILVPAARATPRDAPRDVAPPSTPGVRVDPGLAADLAAGPAPGILAWNPDDASRAEVAAYLSREGIGFRMFEMLDMALACMSSPSDLPALADAPGALSVWGDEVLEPALSHSVPTAMNGDPEAVWSGMGVTGEGVTIAVLDTGIDASHPDLTWHEKTVRNVKVLLSHKDLVGPGNDVPGCPDYVGEDEEDTEVASGHGTHIASVAAGDGTASNGRYRGVAPGASLLGLGVINSAEVPSGVEALGFQPSLMRAIEAVDYILFEGTGENGFITKVALLGFTSEGLFDPFHPLSLSLQYLAELNITAVLPAGNEGPSDSTCTAAETCHINRYSASEWAVTVGATPRTSRTSLEEFSSRGDPAPRTIWGQQFRYEPTLVAPGAGVVAALRPGIAPFATFPGQNRPGATGSDTRRRADLDYQALSGTSVAAAHVAGAIALMQEAAVDAKGCFLTFNQVRQILRDTATPMADYAAHEVGAGALDSTNAVWGALGAPNLGSHRNPWECPGA